MVTNALSGIKSGSITLREHGRDVLLGEGTELQAQLHIHRTQFFRRAFMGGSLAVAESYIQGDWDCSDLTTFFRIFARDLSAASRLDRGVASVVQQFHRCYHWWRRNSRSGSRKNIESHYDLGNDFFRLWLDDTMAYSCGLFRDESSSLREASVEKFDRICRRINLSPGDEVVEIGSGWGGFAIYAAQNYGCHVTTTTISREQFELAKQRIDEAGVADQVTILQSDYRDLSGRFDKLVSIEMVEAVGHQYFDEYFKRCSQLLRPNGACLIQAIVMPDRGYQRYLRSVDFIQRYVFPGGCLPSLGAMLASVARTTDMRLAEALDFAPHYSRTLRAWRDAFTQALPAVRDIGYSEEFIRLWNYYLCYCEAAFDESCIGLLQLVFAKPQYRENPLHWIGSSKAQQTNGKTDR
ncbi:class I SAM-dependent methyltransferase [Lacipirellula sp.]|uniref:class I SAM-dependent methyltransferase n=1 Tax=Lacipirellula sp. TaxID=2691419 RepID=UPI003D0A8319